MPPEGGEGMPLLGGWMTADDLQPATKSVAATMTRPVLVRLDFDLVD
jgi:hypothetical protein